MCNIAQIIRFQSVVNIKIGPQVDIIDIKKCIRNCKYFESGITRNDALNFALLALISLKYA